MKRTVYLDQHPYQRARHLIGNEAITPNPRAANTLGVAPKTLNALAQKILNANNLRGAPALIAHRAMRDAVSETINTPFVEGTARALATTVKRLFRAGA